MHANEKHHNWNEKDGIPCYICGQFWSSFQMRGQHIRRTHKGDDKLEYARQECIKFLTAQIAENKSQVDEIKSKIDENKSKIDANKSKK